MPLGVPLSEAQKAKMAAGRARYNSLSMEEREAIRVKNLAKKQNRVPRKTFEERQALGRINYNVKKRPSDKPRKPRSPNRTFEEKQALGLIKYRYPQLPRTFEGRQALGLINYNVKKQYKPRQPKMAKAIGDIVKEQAIIARKLATARKQLEKEIRKNA